MAATKGRGLLMVFTDVPPEVEDEYNRWYNEEHIPERLSIPGVLSAARYEALQGGPKHLAAYELENSDTYNSDIWQNLLNNPTDWSKRMSPTVVATKFIRNLYRMIYPDDVTEDMALAEMSPTILVGRMSVPSEIEASFNQAYNNERLPECYKVPGYIRNRRFEAVTGGPKYMTVHEMQSVASCESPEWDHWRTMETPVWSSTVRPHMVHEDGSPGVYQRTFPV